MSIGLSRTARLEDTAVVKEIEVRALQQKLSAGEPVHLLDVRQAWEHDLAALPNSQLMPLHELPARVGEVQPATGALLVVYCHHGVRSLAAAHFLERAGVPAVSLAGGIDAWSIEIDPKVPRY
jgi:rhodanese-related sulfurtransferase